MIPHVVGNYPRGFGRAPHAERLCKEYTLYKTTKEGINWQVLLLLTLVKGFYRVIEFYK
jgi:hypothetical protein